MCSMICIFSGNANGLICRRGVIYGFVPYTFKSPSWARAANAFLYSPFAPRGARMENYLAGLDREVDVDDVRFLCSFAIAALADYITAVFNQNFSLIRYAESLTVDTSSFAQIEQKIESPVMKTFFLPVIESLLQSQFVTSAEKLLILISVPFAGTFVPALYCSKILKKAFGKKAFICLGGGFINTELRQADDISLSKYIDAISYDRGYGSYKVLLKKNPFSKEFENLNESFYKLRLFKKDKVIEPLWNDKEIQKFEDDFTVENVPDFSDIDFSRYPRLCDDKNPMHRMWSDGTWIKAYLAHGCYWHKCAFCDTKLDYVCSYKITDVEKLYNGLYQTAVQKGVYGIHFVDEALPPKSLKEFALLNAKNQNKLYFWGNIRFEKSFTKDFAAFLSYCGFGSVSAGIENATSGGLQSINKGIDVSSIVKACAAFKESGILVHAYMIYGFWNDTAQSIIDSMETLRQFFSAGLLDSAFWHKFVLTRNSTVYSDTTYITANPTYKIASNSNMSFWLSPYKTDNSTNYPMFYGWCGNIEGYGAAAMRYTESRMSLARSKSFLTPYPLKYKSKILYPASTLTESSPIQKAL